MIYQIILVKNVVVNVKIVQVLQTINVHNVKQISYKMVNVLQIANKELVENFYFCHK